MTLIAGIIMIATFKFYGNYIDRRVVMLATGIIVNCLAIYFNIRHVAAKVGNDLEKKKFL